MLFRTGGGQTVGFGHVRRCMTLARELGKHGFESLFVLDGMDDALAAVRDEGFSARRAGDGDEESIRGEIAEGLISVVVVDSYAHGTPFVEALGDCRAVVVVLDDLAEAVPSADIVVNGTAGAENLHYDRRPHALYLLGSSYILLRSEFAQEPPARTTHSVRRVLVTLGGGDTVGLARSVAGWIADTAPDVDVDVLLGPAAGPGFAVAEGDSRVHFHRNANVRQLICACDIAVSGGGQTTYELAATATPAVAIRVAPNQTLNLEGLSRSGALLWAGDAGDQDLREKLRSILMRLLSSAESRRDLGAAGRTLVDGKGAVRVAESIAQAVVGRGC